MATKKRTFFRGFHNGKLFMMQRTTWHFYLKVTKPGRSKNLVFGSVKTVPYPDPLLFPSLPVLYINLSLRKVLSISILCSQATNSLDKVAWMDLLLSLWDEHWLALGCQQKLGKFSLAYIFRGFLKYQKQLFSILF